MKLSTDIRGIVITDTKSLPLVLSPSDIAAILGISRNTTYEVLHSKGFPVFKIGKQYRINRDKFLSWLDTVDQGEIA